MNYAIFMQRRLCVRLGFGFAIAIASTLFPVPAVSEPAPGSAPILLLSSQNGTLRAADTINAFTTTWEKTEPGVRVLSQILAAFSFPPSPKAVVAMREAIVERLRTGPPRLIAAQGDLAVDMAVALRAEAFPDCAIVAFEITLKKAKSYEGSPRMRILPFVNFDADIVTLAQRVLPGLETVYVLQNTGPFPDAVEEGMTRLSAAFPRLKVKYVANPTPESTDRALREAGPHTAVVNLAPGWTDESGRFLTGPAFISRLTQRYDLPVFGHIRDDLESGLAGGFGLSTADWGAAAAVTGLDLLAAKGSSDLIVSPRSFARPFLNHAALSRFGVNVRTVPANTELINKPVSFWIRYQAPIQIGIVIMALMLLALVVSVVVRYRIDTVLRWANEKLERQVVERTQALSTTNDELWSSNENLATVLHRTEAMQGVMLKSARESVLGRLAASLANELNSPLNAIASANEASMDVLRDGRDGLASKLQSLDPTQRELFDRYAQIVMHARYGKSNRDYPAARAVETILAAAAPSWPDAVSAEDVAEIASNLVDSGLGTLPKEELAVFASKRTKPVADALYRLSVIFRSGYIITTAVQTVAAAVTAVRAYSASMAVETDIRAFNLGESIDKALSLFQDKLGSSYTIMKKLARNAVLRGDEAAFIRMWTHLIQNALEAMPSGGRLSIRLTGDASLFHVAIGDTGSGVDPSIRDRLFEAFVTTKPTAEGLGLGLSYCKRVAEEVGGSIDYETSDAGTVFTVILPRERKPA